MNTLQGKTALVTGASRGIGRATAMALAHAGARVLVHYRQAAFEANSVVADIRRIGGQADVLKVDLAATNGPAVLAQNAHEFLGRGPLDHRRDHSRGRRLETLKAKNATNIIVVAADESVST